MHYGVARGSALVFTFTEDSAIDTNLGRLSSYACRCQPRRLPNHVLTGLLEGKSYAVAYATI